MSQGTLRRMLKMPSPQTACGQDAGPPTVGLALVTFCPWTSLAKLQTQMILTSIWPGMTKAPLENAHFVQHCFGLAPNRCLSSWEERTSESRSCELWARRGHSSFPPATVYCFFHFVIIPKVNEVFVFLLAWPLSVWICPFLWAPMTLRNRGPLPSSTLTFKWQTLPYKAKLHLKTLSSEKKYNKFVFSLYLQIQRHPG